MSPNKKYYWMKMFDTFFQDPRVKKLKKLPGGDTYIVVMLKIMLQTIKTNGIYQYEGLEKNLSDELELKIDEDSKAIQVVLDYMAGYEMIIEIEKNQYQIPQVQKMIGSETATAERMRKSREKKKQNLLNCNNVTPLLHDVTKCDTEIEIEIEKEKEEYLKYIKNILNDDIAFEVFSIEFYDFLYPRNKKSNQQKIWYGNKIKENILKKDIQTIDNLNRFVELQEQEKFRFNQTQGK